MQSALREFKAQVFHALAHPTRIAIVEALGHGEQSYGTLLKELKLEQANLSQHLAVLRSKQVVTARKAGNQVHYTLRDPVLSKVLTLLRKYFYAHLHETLAMLREIEPRDRRRA